MENQISRAKIHDVAVQLMYSFLILESTNTPIEFEDAVSEKCELPYSECDLYLKEVLIKSLKYQSEISEYVNGFLRNWDFRRLNLVIQAVLIISVCEFYLVEEKIDKNIIINNAVKLSKKYGDGGEKDYKFVNGVLDNCLVNDGKFEALFNK